MFTTRRKCINKIRRNLHDSAKEEEESAGEEIKKIEYKSDTNAK